MKKFRVVIWQPYGIVSHIEVNGDSAWEMGQKAIKEGLGDAEVWYAPSQILEIHYLHDLEPSDTPKINDSPEIGQQSEHIATPGQDTVNQNA